MAWIESHQAVKDHPKRLLLATLMGWDMDSTIGKLHRFWWWCVDYAEDGDLRKFNDQVLGEAVGLNGDTAKQFVEAMVTARWLDRKPYFRVHDWWDYIGRFLQVRYKHYPDKWMRVRDLYVPSRKRTKNGSKTRNQPNPPTQPTQPNQPSAGAREGPAPPNGQASNRVGSNGSGSGSGGSGSGNLANAMTCEVADVNRRFELQSLLAGVDVNSEVQQELSIRRDLSPRLVQAHIDDLKKDPEIKDVAAALVARLRKHNAPRAGVKR